MLAKYLLDKLSAINIHNSNELLKHNCFAVFKWLHQKEPSLSFNALFELYSFYHDLPLNSLNIHEKEKILFKFKQTLPSYLPLPDNTIKQYLQEAQLQAHIALGHNEIPIGAVIVLDNQIIARGNNQTRTHKNIINHAEIIALNEAQSFLQNHRLNNCDLYVTIEPCVMCVGAIMQSRIRRVIFGAVEPKTGAVLSQFNILNNLAVNHQTEGIGPINNDYYSQQICEFLKQKR